MGKLSREFHSILNNESGTISLTEYEQCLSEWKRVHEKTTTKDTVLAILFFLIGLWAVYEHAIVVAVMFLALAAASNHSATLAGVESNAVTTHRLLAMLINKQSQAIESLRREIKEAECSSDA